MCKPTASRALQDVRAAHAVRRHLRSRARRRQWSWTRKVGTLWVAHARMGIASRVSAVTRPWKHVRIAALEIRCASSLISGEIAAPESRVVPKHVRFNRSACTLDMSRVISVRRCECCSVRRCDGLLDYGRSRYPPPPPSPALRQLADASSHEGRAYDAHRKQMSTPRCAASDWARASRHRRGLALKKPDSRSECPVHIELPAASALYTPSQ
jgi:hypothetical protein